jgi:quinol monooxygenase YgiN
MSRLEVIPRMRVREGKLEGFKQQAAECIRLTKESGTPVLRYDWYLTRDGTECELREVYPDMQAFVAQHMKTAEATAVLFNEFADGHQVAVYDPPPELVQRLRTGPTRGNVTFYSFFQGLEPDQPPTHSSVVFEVAAHMTVRPNQQEEFKAQAAEMMRLTRELDTHTLRYDWYLSEDNAECDVREAYVSEAGLIEHNEHIKDARQKLFSGSADNHQMTVYSEASQQLVDLMRVHAGGARWLSFLQGLEPTPTVTEFATVAAAR